MITNKAILRDFFRKKRKSISPQNKKIFSQKIINSLREILENHSFQDRYIALFSGTEEEPDIHSLLENYPQKKFCFPTILNLKLGQMDFFEIRQYSNLEKGKFEILEAKKNCKKIDPEEIGIMCIPAVSIDTKGNRIGMGGGFYDRYLSKVSKNCLKIGVIFSDQISEDSFEEFANRFDIPVDIIISEK